MPFGPQGHTYLWREVESYLAKSTRPLFVTSASPLQDTGAGKIVLLHKIVQKVLGYFPVHNQTIGDCVSHGFGGAIDVLKCCQIDAGNAEDFKAETATEAIYALSRVEIGRGQLGAGDGSVGSWAAEAVKEYGTLARIAYPTVDLTKYDGQRAKKWGAPRAGLPDVLEPIAHETPVQTASLCTSYEQARDAIANKYPVPVCSNQGFTDVRDSQGFCKASGTWSHCMYFLAADDSPSRPGLLCMNSWGATWVSGPTRHDQPPGSFWVDANVANKMLSRNPDSFALSGFKGFPRQEYQWI